ncbi:tyrosine-type recombinase/integrase [bacterium]|nr:tyrosine-type recombinase/integrase [bacterium]
MTHFSFHQVRSHITNMLAQGVPAPQVMSIVDHSKTSTTDEYLKLAGVDVKDRTNALGYRLPTVRSDNMLQLMKS